MFELTIKEAEFHIAELSLTEINFLSELEGLRNAFGEKWLCDELGKKDEPIDLKSKKNPLISWMKVSGRKQVLSIL